MKRRDRSNTSDGINNNTYNMFFMKEPGGSRLATTNDEFLLCAMEKFTELSDEDMDYIIENTNIFKRAKQGFIAERNGSKYHFTNLDAFFDDELKTELRSEARRGKCTHTSVSMAYNYQGECKVLIGYIDNSHHKVLHSVFVVCYPDSDLVFDYTKNLVMKKDDYIKIADYKVINEISGDDLKKDMKTIMSIQCMSSKFYLCFRDEIMKDLKKNEKVFKLNK